jgi:hypothetical protein
MILRRLPLLALGATLFPLSLCACSVPVFRYAFEHWAAAPFEAFVIHRGPLTEAQRAAARDLEPAGLAGRLHANIAVRDVNLDDEPPPELAELARAAQAGSLPWLVVKFPASNRRSATIWSGPLIMDSVAQLLDSPARKEIVQRLAEGQSAVWVLLESGDPRADAAAAEQVEERLNRLKSVLQLPKLDAQDIANGLVSVGQDGLRLDFSMLRIARSDPTERLFVQMLLNSEADLDELKSPILFPVFGQGRMLYALAGDGINDATVEKAATFLIGKCSCEVKEQNPGVDLLLAANWKEILASQRAGIPDLPTMAELTKAAPVTVTITPAAATAAPRADRLVPVMWLVAGGVTIAALLVVVIRRRPE